MRTTLDLPSDLMHAAKVKAAQRGETLKELFTRAISREVRGISHGRAAGRLNLPLIGQDDGPKVEVTNAALPCHPDEFAAAYIEPSHHGRRRSHSQPSLVGC